MVQTILRLEDVQRATGLPRSTIYEKIAGGHFPKPITLSGRCKGWLENEVADWQKARIAERDASENREAA